MQRGSEVKRPKGMFLREPQHTPGSHTPDIPFHPQMKAIPNHKLLVGGLGYAPGVCWKVLRMFKFSKLKINNRADRAAPARIPTMEGP